MEVKGKESVGLATRRGAMGLAAGAVAAAAVTGGMTGSALGATTHNLGSKVKTMFWPAVITPCDKNMKIEPSALRDIIQYLKEQGAPGILLFGTTGEFSSFSVAERKAMAEAALKDKMGLNIIVNPGTPNFPETLELAKHAQDHGADGLLVIPPYYFADPPVSALTRYYSMLLDQTNIPVNLYHIPSTSGVAISIELLNNLKHYPNLAGIKDSEGNKAEYHGFVDGFPELNMRTGTLDKIEYALDHGMGAMLTPGNTASKQIAAVFDAYNAGQDYHPALARLNAYLAAMRAPGVGGYASIHYTLSQMMGTPQSYVRPPFVDPTDAQKAAIREALARAKSLG